MSRPFARYDYLAAAKERGRDPPQRLFRQALSWEEQCGSLGSSLFFFRAASSDLLGALNLEAAARHGGSLDSMYIFFDTSAGTLAPVREPHTRTRSGAPVARSTFWAR